jgi:hypothetical protein
VQKALQDFAEAIDLSKSKVRNGPQKITLFGGKITNSHGQPLSQRGTLLLMPEDLADTFVVPEDYSNWNHFGIYNDLLSFEEDVCALMDSVVVFLESAGAIAEFGALVKNKDIAPKLLVVVNNTLEQDSFINLGLIKYLTSTYSDKTNFIASQDASLQREEASFILEKMRERFMELPKTNPFKASETRHILYLIIDFIDLLQVARITDIQEFLLKLELVHTKRRVEQLLLALKNTEMVSESRVLSERCFYLPDIERPSIEYAFKANVTAKRVSWKAIFFEKTLEQKWRAYAFKVLKTDTKKAQQNVA